MSYPVFTVPDGDTLPIFFDTYDGGTGASITLTGLAVTDIEIYKDGGTTQRSSDAGYTLLDTDGIDFDGTTGIHGFSIDLSDNTDAGFYSVGSWFTVVIASVTVDAQTVNFVAGMFRIMAAEASAGVVDANMASVDADAITASAIAANAIGASEIAADAIGSSELATTAVNEIRDAILSDSTAFDGADIAAILVDTGTTLPAEHAALNDPTAAAIADAVWDEDVVAAHGTSDTGGLLLRALGAVISQRANNATLDAVLGVPDGAGADVPSATTSDVWNRATASHTAGGSFGEEVQAHALSSEVATAQADLDIITGADGANLLSGTQASIDAIEADTNELQTDDVPGLIAALNDLSAAQVNAEVDTAFTTQMADSVPADGSIPTREQALLMITRFLWEKAVSGTTVTVTKEDGTTSNMTFTLDDGTNPTSITRAT